MPDITLTETVTVSQRDASDEEKYLAHRYNRLVDRCLTWAGQQMEYGTMYVKLSLTKSVLASASRLAALDTKSQTETHRLAFQHLLQEMTVVSAATPALDEPAVDQDEDG